MSETSSGTKQKIVAAVDGSPGSRRALSWAVKEAQLRGADLDVLTVWSLPVQWAQGYNVEWAVDAKAMGEEAVAEAEQMLNEELGDGERPDWVQVVALEGAAAPLLIKASASADLLVVGTRGRGGFTRLLLGSVSNAVVQHAECPVVVVPSPVED